MKKEVLNYFGVDISKQRLDVAFLEGQQQWSFANGPLGWRKLIARVLQAGEQAAVVCEASGGYERNLIRVLQEAGVKVALCNARQVRHYARAAGLLAKTDRLDALVLARYGAHFQPALLPVVRPEQKRLRELLLRHRQLTAARVRELNQAEHLEDQLLRRWSRGHLRLLERQIKQIDQLIIEQLATSHQAASAALTSVSGIGYRSPSRVRTTFASHRADFPSSVSTRTRSCSASLPRPTHTAVPNTTIVPASAAAYVVVSRPRIDAMTLLR